MERITNSKFLPDGRFRPYPGFSLLFDNPGIDTRAPLGDHVWLTDRPADALPCPSFYAKLRAGLEALPLGELAKEYLFLDLPLYSYHVTVWDGLNVRNRGNVRKCYRHDLADFLLDLPHSLRPGSKFTALVESSPLVARWDIRFRFDRLCIWGNNVLVARLKPADDKSGQVYATIMEHRRALYGKFESEFGFTHWRDTHDPHVSLGYFGNESSAESVQSQVQRWTEAFRDKVSGEVIQFNSISLYGFLDMATFFRQASKDPAQ